MDSSESVSYSIDTNSDFIDILNTGSPTEQQQSSLTISQPTQSLDLNETARLQSDRILIVDETPPPSASSKATSSSSPSSSSSTLSPPSATQSTPEALLATTTNGRSKKSVLFDTVTIYHFNRSQGFSSIPSQGGSTLGMTRRHFLKRRLSVDLYEEVRRRSRREILLKIKLEKKKNDIRQQQCEQRLLCSPASSSTSNTITSSDSDDDSYSDYSDISDSELDGESVIFVQPVNVKVRRSLLRASGVGRIDPKEKKECKQIRDSRERSGCKCISQCVPEYCECFRLGVNCHVDRISFPCGCLSDGCRNPLGRTEFDVSRVRENFEEKVIKSKNWVSDLSGESTLNHSDLGQSCPTLSATD